MKAIPFLVCLLAGCAGLAVEAPPTESSSFGARTALLSSPTTAPVTTAEKPVLAPASMLTAEREKDPDTG